MNIIFMGTPIFAKVCLEALADAKHNILAVITQPDKPIGRGHKIAFSAVKEYAQTQNMTILQPKRVKNAEFLSQMEGFDADIAVVAAFGQILPKRLLNMPKYGSINVHASLLPKYRGASPIQQAILNGDTTTGITIMQMDEGLDTGDILLKSETPISPDDTAATLHDKLCEIAPKALLDTLELIARGETKPIIQNNDLASYAPLIKKGDAEINWSQTTAQILNHIRAYNPFPVAFTEINGTRLKVFSAESCDAPQKNGITLPTADGFIKLNIIQAPNGKKMPSEDYMRGRL